MATLSKSMYQLSLDKRMLVVSAWAPPMTGGPQNLYNLLSQFSPQSYCILTSYEAIQRGKTTGAWLAGEYFFYDCASPVEKTVTSSSSRPKKALPARAYESLVLSARRIRRHRAGLLESMFHLLYLILNIFMIVRMATRIVRHRKIGCVMGISDAGPALISTYFISRLTNLPYVLYLFDIYLGNDLVPAYELFAKMFEPLMFKAASLVLVTNEGAERFYRRRYGNNFKCALVHNSIFPADYESKRTAYNPSEPFTILFTGNVYWAQEQSIMNVIEAMEQLRDLRVRLDLYVPNATGPLRQLVATRPNIRLAAAAQSEMPAIQCNATILFLPLSWHTRSPQVIATATPGKLADYLASGRPILVHAPPYAYVNEYARRCGFALSVEEENIEKLTGAVRKLISDPQYSRRLIENAERTLYENHDATVNARKLANLLESL